ncbi:uncharacterized protein O3C94_008734 [Discoglossus pictus]
MRRHNEKAHLTRAPQVGEELSAELARVAQPENTVQPGASHPGKLLLQREKVFIRLSAREQLDAMQRLTDLQREAELKCASDRRRQMLRFQERLSIARNRKSEEDLLGTPQRGSPQVSPEPPSQETAERQKTAVRERLERVKRERTYIMQTRRDRNTTSFRELLSPVLTRSDREEGGSGVGEAEGV